MRTRSFLIAFLALALPQPAAAHGISSSARLETTVDAVEPVVAGLRVEATREAGRRHRPARPGGRDAHLARPPRRAGADAVGRQAPARPRLADPAARRRPRGDRAGPRRLRAPAPLAAEAGRRARRRRAAARAGRLRLLD